MTSVIPMVRWHESEMVAISRSMGASRTGDEDWSKSRTFTWGTPLTQLRGQ